MPDFIIPEEMDSDLDEFEVKHDQIAVEIFGGTVYLTQVDINGRDAIKPNEQYDAMISLGRAQAEALYFALGKFLGLKSGAH